MTKKMNYCLAKILNINNYTTNKMKKLNLTLIFLLVGMAMFSQTNLYENPNFKEIAKDHKIIGIIPFSASVTLKPKQMKKFSSEDIKKMEESEGKSIQNAMYSWFLKRKKRGSLTVNVQDPYITNAKMKKNGIMADNYEKYTPKELADMLEVDAIVMGTFETTKPLSELASAALAILIGFWGPTNRATINLKIYNAKDGELLINYQKSVSGSLGSSTEKLINKLMRKASRRIAYTE